MASLKTESVKALFEATQRAAASTDLPSDSWYLIVAVSLASVGRGNTFGELFEFAASASSAEQKRALSRRLREVIIKSWTLIGMPCAISASYALQVADPEGDSAVDHQRADVISQPNLVMQRSQDWFTEAFKEDEQRIFAGFVGHKEMEWTLRYIVYGFFLSDLTVMTPIENEMIVLASVIKAGGSPTQSHYKILRRLGVSARDGAVFVDICGRCAQWAGVDTSAWPKAEAMESLLPSKF